MRHDGIHLIRTSKQLSGMAPSHARPGKYLLVASDVTVIDAELARDFTYDLSPANIRPASDHQFYCPAS